MIAITRSLARQLRAVFRRDGIRRGSSPTAWIAFLAQDQVLRIRLATADVAVEYCLPGEFAAEQMLLPYESLVDFEGSKPDEVLIEAQSDGKTLVRWSDHGVPQMTVYDTIPLAEAAVFPNMPDSLLQNEPAIWQALHDAVQTADKQRSRYALDSLRLRGDKADITATDGRQILVQAGFQFPWHDDVLIPASALLGCREISCNEAVAVGRGDDWAVFRIGPWSVYSKIERRPGFPSWVTCLATFSRRHPGCSGPPAIGSSCAVPYPGFLSAMNIVSRLRWTSMAKPSSGPQMTRKRASPSWCCASRR